MPVCDQLPECLSLPAHFRPATSPRAATTVRAKRYGNTDAGAIPAASPSCVINRGENNVLRLRETRASFTPLYFSPEFRIEREWRKALLQSVCSHSSLLLAHCG